MPTLRTIKKGDDTGRLDRAQVREAVIRVRDAREQRKRSQARPDGLPSLEERNAGTTITRESAAELRKAG